MPGNTTLIEPAKEAAQRRKELAQGPGRKYPLDFKLQIMNEIAAPRTPGPAAVAETKPAPRRKAGPSPRRSGCGRAGRFIEIMLPGGYAVRAEADVNDAALRRVLRAVRELS